MKIVINAVSAKMGGAANYITSLLGCFAILGADFQFVVFLPPETAAGLTILPGNIRVVPTVIGHKGAMKRIWWEQTALRRILKKQKADVLFSTGNFAMLFCPVRQVLLISNALYFSRIYREMFLARHSLRFRLAFAMRRRLACWSVKAADVVMTPTRALLNDLRRSVKVQQSNVNPFGVAPVEKCIRVSSDMPRPSARAESRTIRLLYISLYSEHKNLGTLLKALAILNHDGGPIFKLTTTANPAWPGAKWTVTHAEDLELARQPGIAEYIDFLGPLRHVELGRLYRDADIFVFPSLAESFGFPMAEAMSYGLPILAADTPVNREVCGDAAFYFRPLDPEHLASQLLALAATGPLLSRLGERGQREATRRFSWNAHAARLIETACSLSRKTVLSRDVVVHVE
ncbi:MAG TPA: glycosyltransferase family 1 protein [Terriglobia bacterium]|jgi:glycosyltransferase involved in cell wall biosynthesis|nr:glycosyltransferase family 1 protein [Terriglobia bacterium]